MNVLWYNKAHGGVAEWSNALVLKTRVSQGTVSSNLTPSAFKPRPPSGKPLGFPRLPPRGLKLLLRKSRGYIFNMTKIMIFGTFDMIHPGHEDLFYQARSLAPDPYLIVSLARDSAVIRHKGKAPRNTEEARKVLLEAHADIDKVVVGDERGYIEHIQKEQPDIIALGYDQQGEYVEHLERDLKDAGLSVRVVRLEPFQEHAFKTSKLQS